MEFFLTSFFTFLPFPICFFYTFHVYREWGVTGLQDCFPFLRKFPENVVIVLSSVINATPLRVFLITCEDRNLLYQLYRNTILPVRIFDISPALSLNSLIETNTESTPQLILQSYLFSKQFIAERQITQQTNQLFSIVTALIGIVWTIRGQHVKEMQGKLSFPISLVISMGILFLIIVRVIACTAFTIAYTWVIFIVAAVHFTGLFCVIYFSQQKRENIIPATVTSLMFGSPRIRIGFGKEITYSFLTIYLCVAAIENCILLSSGLSWFYHNNELSEGQVQSTIITCAVACALFFILGIAIHALYYQRFHPKRTGQ